MPLPAKLPMSSSKTLKSSSAEKTDILANRYFIQTTLGAGNCGTALLVLDRKDKDGKEKLLVSLFNFYVYHIMGFVSLSIVQGAPIKNNPLKKILYLQNCSRFFHQIYAVYRGGFRPCIQQIAFKYLVWFQNYNYLNLKVYFF